MQSDQYLHDVEINSIEQFFAQADLLLLYRKFYYTPAEISIHGPAYDKTNKMTCAPCKDTDQPVFAGCTCHFVGFVVLWIAGDKITLFKA